MNSSPAASPARCVMQIGLPLKFKTFPMELSKAKILVQQSAKILVFSGAGISKESGIPTFREDNGIWKEYSPFLWGTKTGLVANFHFNIKTFSRFFTTILDPIAQAIPNEGHLSLVELEKDREVFIFTQNIDNLHQEAGSKNVNEIHGNIFEITCKKKITKKLTKAEFTNCLNQLKAAETKKEIRATFKNILDFKNDIRPNIVLFNEVINQHAFDSAIEFAKDCDCLIIVGTSLNVYPAASIASEVSKDKIINVGYDSIKGVMNLIGNASEILPLLLN
jgi:NAD-dependent deacetylase